MSTFVARGWVAFAASISLFAIPSCSSAQPPATEAAAEAPAVDVAAPAPEGHADIQSALTNYIAAFNSHDADALAALWSDNAVHVDKETGERTEGRAALAEDFRALFAASPEIVLAGEISGVRMISDGVAMVDGVTTTITPDGEPSTSSYSAILVNQGGKWLVDSVHESEIPSPVMPRSALEPLAWLVGHWQDATDDAQVDTYVRWSANEAFLIRSFVVSREGEEPFEGTQVIGWDPRAGNIRSWTFSADGSFGESVWSAVGDEWHVITAQTLADGRAATATQIIRRIDDDTATVQTIGKEIDGNPEPASDPVTIARVVEEPAADEAAPAGAEAEPAAVGAAAPAEEVVR
jgi:uncharacterized protein (TIGR02246 family)